MPSASDVFWNQTFVDAAHVAKSYIRQLFRDNTPYVIDTKAAFRLTNMLGTKVAIIGGVEYVYDPADTVSADNDSTILVSLDGLRYDRVLTDTATLAFDFSTAKRVSANVPDNSISNAKIRDSAALSVIGRASNTSGDPADISAVAASGAVLRESGSAIGFGTVATAGIANDAVDNTKIRNSGALSVIGRSTNSAGDPADISATAAGNGVLLERSNALLFATIQTANIADGQVTFAKLATAATDNDAALAANSATVLPTQQAVKSYVDNLISGLKWKREVVVRTTANITLSGEQTIDGVLTAASRVLVMNQSTGSQNGIYLSSSGAWTRVTDADTAAELLQATVFVSQGTTYSDTQWTCTNNSITLGTTALTFAQVSGAGTYSADEVGVTLSANQFALKDNGVTDARLRDSIALSVIGRGANSTGDPGDIQAGTDGHVLRRSGTTLAFGTIATAGLTDDAVTNAKLANVATATFKGRTTAGTGDPEDLTATQATALLNVMVGDSGAGGTKGLVPAPGAGDAAAGKFLKADASWQVPAGGAAAVTLLNSGTISSAATLDIVLTAYTGYRSLKFILQLTPATDAVALWCRTSTDGGSTYDATGYNYIANRTTDTPTTTAGGSGSNTEIVLSTSGTGIGNAATEGWSGYVDLFDHTSAALWTRILFQGYFIDAAGTPNAVYMSGGGAREAAADVDAIRFLFSSGNIASGKWAVFGLA